jgi:alpha-L-fucosidase
MSVNGKAIYGTSAGPFDFDFPWGSMSQKDKKLYLHILKWQPGFITIPGIINTPENARLLQKGGNHELSISKKNGIVTISVPKQPPTPYVNIIELEFENPIQTAPRHDGKYIWTTTPGPNSWKKKNQSRRKRR